MDDLEYKSWINSKDDEDVSVINFKPEGKCQKHESFFI